MRIELLLLTWFHKVFSLVYSSYQLNSDQMTGFRCDTTNLVRNSVDQVEIIQEAKVMANYAGMAYCDKNTTIGSTILYDAIYSNKSNLKSKIYIDDINQDIIISIRGSEGLSQAITLIGVQAFNDTSDSEIEVYEEFNLLTNEIKPKILNKLSEYFINEPACYRIVLVGHSLGGAMAVLLAPDIKSFFNLSYHQLAVYTYGQPRVGNAQFANYYRSENIYTIRTVNNLDTVPHMPHYPAFIHVGRELFIYEGDHLCLDTFDEDINCSTRFFQPIDEPGSESEKLDCGERRERFVFNYNPTYHNSVWNTLPEADSCN